MYILTKKVNAHGVKLVLSGEGSNEILGGYPYFKNSPNWTGY